MSGWTRYPYLLEECLRKKSFPAGTSLSGPLLLTIMKKILLALGCAAALASCRETNTAVQSNPTTGTPDAKVLRFDTTFLKTGTARAYPHTYTGRMVVGEAKKVVVPVQINWTTVEQAGCPQVASVQVYQLNGSDRRTILMAKAIRDGVCKPAQRLAGSSSTASAPAYAGAAYLKLTTEAREIRRTTSVSLTINGLGYHDILNGDSAATSGTR